MQVNAETGRPQGSGAESQTDAGAGAGGSKESNAESHVGSQPQTGAGAGANGSETQSCVDDGTSRPLGSGTQPQTSATACGGGFGGSNPHSHVDASASGLQGPSASIDTQYTPQAPPGVGAQQHSSNQAQIGAESIGSQGSSTNAHSQSAQSGLSDNPGIAATRSQAYAGAGAGGSYGSGAAISSQPLDSASSIGQVASTTQQKAGGGANGLGESTLTGSPQPGRSGMPSDHLTSIQQQAAGAGAGSGASGPYQSMLTASSPAENSGASNGNTASSIVYQASANVSGSQGSILTSDPQLEHDISQGVSGQAASSTMPLASPYAGGSQRSAFTTALSATGFAGNGTAGKASSAMSISGDRGGLPPAIASANPQSGHDTSGVYIGPGTSSTQLPAGAGADSSQGSSFTAGVQSEQSIAEPSNVHDNSSILLQVGSVEGGLQTSTITVNRQSAQVAGETSKYQMRTTTDEIKEPVLTDSALSGYSTNQAGTGTQRIRPSRWSAIRASF